MKQTRYSFDSRFAEGPGTNPEELLAAAHASCFTMTLVYALSQKGLKSNEVETTAAVSVDLSKGGITNIDLTLHASPIDRLQEAEFIEYAVSAKQSCLLSKALAGVNITLSVNYGILQPQA